MVLIHQRETNEHLSGEMPNLDWDNAFGPMVDCGATCLCVGRDKGKLVAYILFLRIQIYFIVT